MKTPAVKEKKTLQKFTQFEKLRTVEDFRELQKTDPKKLDEVQQWLQDKITTAYLRKDTENCTDIDKYYDRLERCIEVNGLTETWKVQYKRDRWNLNEAIIKKFMHKTMTTKGYLPTNTEISTATGLSRVTVIEHIKGNSLSMFKAEEREQYKMLNSSALNELYFLAFAYSNVKALKMFIELTKDDNNTVVNNFIQINNTKIDTVLIEKLPAETRRQIETLILENLPE